MTAMQTSTRATIRPGTDWPGWLGYAPQARGPEARRARALAAGLEQPSPVLEPTLVVTRHDRVDAPPTPVLAPRCAARHRTQPARPVRSAPRRPSLV